MEHSESKIEKKTVREVSVREFDEEIIRLVGYDDSVISSSKETTVRNYLNLHVREYPELMDAIDDGVHTFEACWKYITESLRKLSKDGCAMVSSDRVFKMAVNFYMSPIVEKEVEERKPVSTFVSSFDSEEAKREREEREMKRKEDERRRKLEEDVKRNGPMLFEFC